LRAHAQIYLVLPHCNSGDLFDYVQQRTRLSEEQARPLFRQLVQGLAFLHAAGICHRDVSPENVLVRARARLWCADHRPHCPCVCICLQS
jgi:serine/threonine protein kinase